MLKERLDSLLKKEEWRDFEQYYHDLETEDGLICFARHECLNPQRIPSLVVEKWDGPSGSYVPLRRPQPIDSSTRFRPLAYVGLETDYSERGRGIVTPQMVTDVLVQALEL